MKFSLFLSYFFLSLAVLEAKGVEDANGYSHNSNLQWNGALDVIQSINWVGSERVLDVGCGDGKITALIAKDFSKGTVVGLDISESMIHFASSQFAKKDFPNLLFLTGSADKLPFELQFDVIVSFYTLHWVIDQEKALQDIYKSLSNGGKAYLLTCGKAPMNLATVSESVMATEKWSGLFSNYVQQRVYFTEEEYRSLLQKVGFRQVQLTSQWSETIYPNRDALIGSIKPLLNFINHLSVQQQEQFVSDVADQIITQSEQENGKIPFKVLKLKVLAEK